ncbi:hypothetical protein LshimejAT787_1800510 [Lyophyllum shimeji]|uniref:Uncharacterized protein n=1 Tax=Lyophyllum shimeji TaxID=47721 RepID=A0A9P3Q088_LYOSH|nr:hypothetical protein LshimejAT787_1800510 [Lyophyllum shimeji]
MSETTQATPRCTNARSKSRAGNTVQASLDDGPLSVMAAPCSHGVQRRAVNPLRLGLVQQRPMRPLPSSRSTVSGTLVDCYSKGSEVTALEPASRRAPMLYWGSDVLWRGYGAPKNTGVSVCTASDGYHDFGGKGMNGYKTSPNGLTEGVSTRTPRLVAMVSVSLV